MRLSLPVDTHWARAAWRRSLGRWRLFRVAGHSMRPTLIEGDWLLVDCHSVGLPDTGELVVLRAPGDGAAIVKRVRSHGERTFSVGSDDPIEGRDSRHFGSLPASALLGRVVSVKRFGRRQIGSH